MDAVVWLGADTLTWPEGGGIFWVYLNWALGLRANGCRVVWLERAESDVEDDRLAGLRRALETKLERYGLGGSLALYREDASVEGTVALEEAAHADLLLNLAYDAHVDVLDRFPRTALVDIDPGLTQVWATEGTCPIPPHDFYFTTGETVGKPEARFPDYGLRWDYTPACVALDWWPTAPAPARTVFTTVSNWGNPEWFADAGTVHDNNKRAGFRPYIALPTLVPEPFELALCLDADADLRPSRYELAQLDDWKRHGWRIRHSYEVASTPWDYQQYIQGSSAEFSCSKPSFRLLASAWISDRTICYLATGRPAVVEHTGPSSFLPDRAGLFRFSSLEEAVECVQEVAGDWETHARLARELAADHFDARAVTERLLGRALGKPSLIG
jgi:hypothetical protein